MRIQNIHANLFNLCLQNEYFDIVGIIGSERLTQEVLDNGKGQEAMVIPPHFSKIIRRKNVIIPIFN